MQNENLVVLEQVEKHFPVKSGFGASEKMQVKAVDKVSFSILKGETFGLVGESGCGKSTLGRCILKLYPLTGGSITYENKDISSLRKNEMPLFRRKCQMIFQDPAGCLNPRRNVRELLLEPLVIHNLGSVQERDHKIAQIMDRVGIGSHYLERYPHEISGGQKQRIGIARALLLDPELIICDEPVSALDASIQAQVLNLLSDLQQEFNLTYLFISHNLSVVNYVSDRVGVMYCGKIVELADKKSIYDQAAHPYTKALISAIPTIHIDNKPEEMLLEGDIPSPIQPPSGCRFHPRCPEALELCTQEEPDFRQVRPGHWIACHNV